MGSCTILILRKYGFKICVISFSFIPFILKVYIYLPWINTHLRGTAPFDNTCIISSSDHQKTGLYMESADCCDEDHKSDLIVLIQQSQAIDYCNQSVLVIVPDLNTFVFSITNGNFTSRSALVRFCFLYVRYLYDLTGIRFYILFS